MRRPVPPDPMQERVAPSATPRYKRLSARLAFIAVALVLVPVAFVVVKPLKVGLQTLLLLPAMFPGAPLDPLTALTQPPTRTEHSFTYAAGTVEADIYHPASTGPHGGAVLMLGAVPVPRRDPLVVRFTEALSRTGIVVIVPESSNLLEGRVVPEELEALSRSFHLLLAQDTLDTARVGFLGFSVGGALSVAASAARPELREQVRFVNSLGGYYDAEALLVDMASRSIEVDGQLRPWEPDPRTIQVLGIALIDTLDAAEDRRTLERFLAVGEGPGPDDLAGLSEEARLIAALITGTTRTTAQQIVAGLSPRARARLAALSPSTYVHDLRARLFLMHDTADPLIPFTQSRSLAAATSNQTLARYTEFSIFAHVIPDKPVPWMTFVPELWSLYWHVHAVLMEVL